MDIAVWLFLTVFLLDNYSVALEVIYAINAGGDEHVDTNGIHYKRDPLFGKIGTASEYGRSLLIGRAPRADQVLYQTERYHHNTFGYDVPISEDGDYVLILKFSEVYFEAPGQKVFDVVINDEHTVVSQLDIYSRVGKGVAHDELIPFQIRSNKLLVFGHESTHTGKIRVDFVKGSRDNPKINAIVVIKGKISDVPHLSPVPAAAAAPEKHHEDALDDEEEEEDEPLLQHSAAHHDDRSSWQQQEEDDDQHHRRRTSGPRSPDPYAIHQSSPFATLMPIFAAIGAFIPLLFCLCKL